MVGTRVHISHSKAVMPWVGITVLSVMHGQCDANPIRTPSCTATSTLWQPVSNYTARCVCVCVLLAQGRYPKSSAMTTTKNQELLTSCCSVRTALRQGHVSSVTFPKHRSDVGWSPSQRHMTAELILSGDNKDWTCKDKDKNKDQAYKDQDKD